VERVEICSPDRTDCLNLGFETIWDLASTTYFGYSRHELRDYFGTLHSHKVAINGPGLAVKISRFYSKWHDEYAYYVIACTDVPREELNGIANRYVQYLFLSDFISAKMFDIMRIFLIIISQFRVQV
jgi:hypothetical protein